MFYRYISNAYSSNNTSLPFIDKKKKKAVKFIVMLMFI